MEKPAYLFNVKGPIGKNLFETNFENLKIVDFEPILIDDIDIDQELVSDLSSDQKYLLEMHQEVLCRCIRQWGSKLSLTTASHILPLHIFETIIRCQKSQKLCQIDWNSEI